MSSETNERPRDASIPTDDDSTNHPYRDPDRGRNRGPGTRRRVLAATLQAETELLQAKCDELEATNEELKVTNEELEAEIENLESELERKRRELREVVTRYERLIAERREATPPGNGDADRSVRTDAAPIIAAATRMRHRVFDSST